MRELTALLAKKTHQSSETVSVVDKPLKSTEFVKYIYTPCARVGERTQAVIQEALDNEASCIVVGTQLEGGHIRGGFAERLAHQSPIPVLLLSPKMIVPKSIRKILFAADFTESSMIVFRQLCQFAIECAAEIKIVHAVYPDQALFLDSPPLTHAESSIVILDKVFERDLIIVRRGLEKFVQYARRHSLKTSIEIQPMIFSRAEVIMGMAHEWKPDIIAVGSGGSGTFRGHLFGSTTISLVHSSVRPLWIFNPKRFLEA
jgi:nucleotide-binding universal stress UspA family protein